MKECFPFRTSHSGRSLFSVARPVDSLNVVRVIVPPRSSHPSWADVVRYDAIFLSISFRISALERTLGIREDDGDRRCGGFPSGVVILP